LAKEEGNYHEQRKPENEPTVGHARSAGPDSQYITDRRHKCKADDMTDEQHRDDALHHRLTVDTGHGNQEYIKPAVQAASKT
jgi:hypothetical protein